VSQAASQAAAFYRDVARNRKVWTVRDAQGFPAPKTPDRGPRAAVLVLVGAGRASRLHSAGVQGIRASRDFVARIPREMAASDGLKVGLNWGGPRAVGYDREPSCVRQSVEAVKAFERLSGD
jgi:hypothetical protein